MAKIAMTFADQPDGKVEIQVYLDGVVEGSPSPAQRLAQAMLKAAKEDTGVTDVQPITH
jgi:hypothetical protein